MCESRWADKGGTVQRASVEKEGGVPHALQCTYAVLGMGPDLSVEGLEQSTFGLVCGARACERPNGEACWVRCCWVFPLPGTHGTYRKSYLVLGFCGGRQDLAQSGSRCRSGLRRRREKGVSRWRRTPADWTELAAFSELLALPFVVLRSCGLRAACCVLLLRSRCGRGGGTPTCWPTLFRWQPLCCRLTRGAQSVALERSIPFGWGLEARKSGACPRGKTEARRTNC